ncbi:hypothetical protein GQ457_11G023260 [Hibiscus cannabinus]
MDERELVDPLRCAREWIWDQENSIEKNKAWTKKAIIHILVLAQQEGSLSHSLRNHKLKKDIRQRSYSNTL